MNPHPSNENPADEKLPRRSSAPSSVHAECISEAKRPQNEGGNDERSGGDNGEHPAQAATDVPVEKLPGAGNHQVAKRADVHEENVT